ncbi:MAG: hypothetical protein ACRDFS_04130 [Chloroflexota bacterium]
MIQKLDPPEIHDNPNLTSDFTGRLERSLPKADRRRSRRLWLQRIQLALPALFLVGPIVWWRITARGPDGALAAVHALAGLTFLLDVAVHVDAAVLTYLGLQLLPSVVGLLLLALITGWLLFAREDPR